MPRGKILIELSQVSTIQERFSSPHAPYEERDFKLLTYVISICYPSWHHTGEIMLPKLRPIETRRSLKAPSSLITQLVIITTGRVPTDLSSRINLWPIARSYLLLTVIDSTCYQLPEVKQLRVTYCPRLVLLDACWIHGFPMLPTNNSWGIMTWQLPYVFTSALTSDIE